MTDQPGAGVLVTAEELDALRRDAARYRWLRERAVRLQGSDVWWLGGLPGPARRHRPGACPGRIHR